MKYLKYFESEEHKEDYIRDYGVTPDDILYLFTDLVDMGWGVKTRFYKKLYKFDIHEPIEDGDIKLGLVPYIEVTITKDWPRFDVSIWQASQYLNQLINSPEYLEMIEVVSLRLSDENLFIQKQYIENKQIHILIYKKTDKNYVK
jgi:hypothetical protein